MHLPFCRTSKMPPERTGIAGNMSSRPFQERMRRSPGRRRRALYDGDSRFGPAHQVPGAPPAFTITDSTVAGEDPPIVSGSEREGISPCWRGTILPGGQRVQGSRQWPARDSSLSASRPRRLGNVSGAEPSSARKTPTGIGGVGSSVLKHQTISWTRRWERSVCVVSLAKAGESTLRAGLKISR